MFQDKSDYFETDRDNNIDVTDNNTENIEEPTEHDIQSQNNEIPKPRHRHRFRNFMLWLLFFVILAGSTAFYIRYYNPYAIDAHEYGTIVNLEKRGILFKTYEADMATRTSLHDTSKEYVRQNFSFANDSLAHVAQHIQQEGKEAELTYSRYFATLPWRGASVRVITDIRPCTTQTEPQDLTPDSSHQMNF